MRTGRLTIHTRLRVRRAAASFAFAALLMTGAAGAQTPAPKGPPGPPPIPALLGAADFMLTIDRPFEAEKIYRAILHMDPHNQAAQQGLQDVARAKRPTFTVLSHYYFDTHDVELFAWGGGPTFRTPYGRITLTAGTGYYKNDNNPNNKKNPLGPVSTGKDVDDFGLQKSTVNLLLEPYYKQFEGYYFLSEVLYDGAPDRFLYDLETTYVPDPARKRYTLTVARRDSFLQSDKNEFFAPESYYAVAGGLTLDETSVNIDHPLASRVDFSGYYANFDYSDGNHRNVFRTQFLYRLLPKSNRPMPVFRVGLAHLYDNTDHFAAFYYSPQDVQTLSLVTDYVNLTRRLKYGVVGSFPLTFTGGSGFAKHTPALALFSFINYQVAPDVELYFKAGGINSPGYDLTFRDFVFGINGRF
jgi:hypothetical protein